MLEVCTCAGRIGSIETLPLAFVKLLKLMLPATTKSSRPLSSKVLSRVPVCRRSFQSQAEFSAWRNKVRSSTLAPTSLKTLDLKEAAPFLHSVDPLADHLELSGMPTRTSAGGKSPRDSLLQCKYPLSSDALLRNSVSDFSNWSSFRLGKFYETVDALTADVAYRHCDDIRGEAVTLVTAGHYHSRKFERTQITQDVSLRSYVTSVGTSSMEVRTDALQKGPDGSEVLLNVCHTVMVALDPKTGSSLGKVGKRVPPLMTETTDDEERLALAKQHNEIRRLRSSQAMQLRAPVSAPPTEEEMKGLHRLHQLRARRSESGSDDISPMPPRVADYTFRSSTVIFPEQRNVHGKLFGGFVMEEAQKLSQYTASFFSKGKPIFPLGIDDAIFLQPIAIGDLVTFTARLVHSTEHTCRVLVTVEVRDPAHRARVPVRSNRLMFVFGGSTFPAGIVPETYSEILMHIDAQRRYHVEGPTESEVRRILEESTDTAA